MSIDDNVDVIGSSLQNIKNAIEAKGVTPSGNITTYAAAIGQIQGSTPVEIDGVTITKNTNNELQTVGIINDNSGNAVKVWVGTQAEFDAITTKDPSTMYYITDQEEEPVQSERNVGEIVMSTIPLTDAGLHLLDGALINGSGSYADFVDYMEGLVADYPDLFVSEADWQTSVTTYGVCGKFVYDSGNYYAWYSSTTEITYYTTSENPQIGDTIFEKSDNTFVESIETVVSVSPTNSYVQVIVDGDRYRRQISSDEALPTVRLPKVTGIIEGTTDVTALGDLVEAGLPNITGSWHLANGGHYSADTNVANGAFTYEAPYLNGNNGATLSNFGTKFSFDASRSSSTYGNSSTVQPQTIKAFYYIVIATSTKTDIQVDIDTIATDLNGKADVDLTNVNYSGASKGANWAMPSNTREYVTFGANGSYYTAPANGYFYASAIANSSVSWLSLQLTSNSLRGLCVSVGSSQGMATFVPIKQGEIVQLGYNDVSDGSLCFIYAEGSKHEA